MENLGALAILLAFCLSLFAVAASLAGKYGRRPFLAVSGERAVYSVWVLLTVAAGLLVYSLITGDFRIAYVQAHSNHAMSPLYKFTAWWGGQEGSLLLWSWILASYSAVAVWTSRRKFRNMMPIVIAILMTTQAFFTGLITFVLSPFQVLMAGNGIISVPDGRGLDPLLQWWTMAIHPPMLYLGYVGSIVPFAFAMASLVTHQPGEGWIHTTRRWAIVTWLFQTTGITLGMGWAYTVLSWGGYWGWDPVENASLMPWITATAFLHSVMMQEKKGMMKVWNMVLVSSTFFLSIFGTFLTRSGVVQSVHAFAQSDIGKYFAIFLTIGIALTVYLILNRLDYLKSEAPLESVVSRESSFLFNNLILLAACFAILWGTLFPVISEAISGEKISVDAPFFNRVNVPIGLFLLFLTGVGPLIAWRRSSLESLKRAFLWPAIAGLAFMGILAGFGIWQHPYALMSFGLSVFVTSTIVMEFWKGSSAIRAKTGMPPLAAMIELTHRNTRRYGGYVVHLAIVFLFVGFTGQAFNQSKTVEVPPGGSFDIGHYHLQLVDQSQGENQNYQWSKLKLAVSSHGRDLGIMQPEKRFYISSRQPDSEVAIRRRPSEDLYLNFAGMSNDDKRPVLQAYVFPLVSWIWLGWWILFIGSVICLIPSKIRLAYARTQVVGITEKHVPVEN